MTNELVAAVDVRFESWFNAKGWNAFPFQRATWEAYLHRYNQLLWTQARCMVH